MSGDIVTFLITISGRVQAVGFRDFAEREARALMLDGWVRNRAEGTVEALASGPRQQVEAFVTRCLQGPRAAQVQNIDLASAKAPTTLGFSRLPTL